MVTNGYIAAESTVITPRRTVTNRSGKFIDTRTKNGRPVWNNVRPIQYMISDPTNTRKSLFLKVDASDLNIFALDGVVSTNSFSLRRKVGKSMATNATAASTINRIR